MEKKQSNNKAMIIGTVAIVVVLVIAVIFLSRGSSTKLSDDPEEIMANLERESSLVTEGEKGEFGAQINVNQYLELYNQEGKYSVVYVARPTCGYCKIVTPVIQKIIKEYSIYMSYLNTDDFSEDDMGNFVKSDDLFSEGFGTPMLLIVGDGKILDSIDGATDTAHFIEFLKKYKFIKE